MDQDALNEQNEWLSEWLLPGQPPRLSRRRMFVEECRVQMRLALQTPGGPNMEAWKAWRNAAMIANDIFAMPPGQVDIEL